MLGRPLLRSIWFDNQCILGSSGSFIGILITSSFNQAWLEVCTESSEFDYLDGYLGLYGMRSSMQVFASIVAHVSILFIAHRDTRTIRGFSLHSKHTYNTWTITLDFVVFPTRPGVNSCRSLAPCSKEETWIDDLFGGHGCSSLLRNGGRRIHYVLHLGIWDMRGLRAQMRGG